VVTFIDTSPVVEQTPPDVCVVAGATMRGCCITPAIQLQAVFSKARDSALAVCISNAPNCDGFLKHRACQVQ
jgi:hypothetical protein